MSMESEAAIAAPIISPISSLKYGKCHFSGASTTPSSDTNSDATTFLIRISSESMFQPNIRQAKYPRVALLRIGELRRIHLLRASVNRVSHHTSRSGWVLLSVPLHGLPDGLLEWCGVLSERLFELGVIYHEGLLKLVEHLDRLADSWVEKTYS